jgi:hypothetical protein
MAYDDNRDNFLLIGGEMKRGFQVLLTVSSLILGGCGVVPLMGPAFLAVSEYQFNKDGELDFRINRKDPDAQSLDKIVRAKTIALYPTRQNNDGEGVDIFRQNTNLTVISSTKTIQWADKNNSPNLKSMPSDERTEIVARMARSVGADLGLFVTAGDPRSEVKGFIHKEPVIKIDFTTYIVDAKTEKTLWAEDQQIYVVVSSGGKTPGVKEINAAAAKGIASRLMDLRLGRTPTAAKPT